MSSPFAGGYHYESPEARVLGSIKTDRFDYKDQEKNLIQLNNAVGYMSSYMRKMQKGIDSANENFIQQLQGFVNDMITMVGGGGDTGFEFGDIKYVFQGLGALMGWDDHKGLASLLPLNLFESAWHFMSNYVLPTNNFMDMINAFIDSAIATLLDIFGEIPIVGQALEQLASWLSKIRDNLGTFWDTFRHKTQSGPNYVIDASFESTSNWQYEPGIRSADQKRNGNYSRKLTGSTVLDFTANGTDTTWAERAYDVVPGQKFAISCWIYRKAGNSNNGSAWLGLQATPGGTSGVDYLIPTNGKPNFPKQQNILWVPGVWARFSFDYTVPDTGSTGQPYTSITPFLYLDGVDPTDVFYVDQLLFKDVTENQNLLQQIIYSLSGSGAELADVDLALKAIPGTNIGSPVDASVVPALDASKITTGVFPQSQITNLGSDLNNKLSTFIFDAKSETGSNLVYAPNFDVATIDRYAYGTLATADYSTEQKHSGSKSYKILITDASTGISFRNSPNNNFWPVTPGDVYYCEVWIRAHASNSFASANGIKLGADCYNSITGSLTLYPGITINNNTTSSSAWTKISGYVTMPANCDRAVFYLLFGTNFINNVFYVDDVTIREVTKAAELNAALYGAGVTSPAATVVAAAVPSLDASKVTTGTFGNALIASGLDAAKLTTGTLPIARIGSGAVTNTYLGSDIAGSKIASAILAAIVPALDASKITTGAFGQAQVTNLTSDLSAKLASTSYIDHISNALTGEPVTSGNALADALAALQKTYNTLADHAKQIKDLAVARTAQSTKGTTTTIDFSSYSAFPAGAAANQFTLTYTGTGTSVITVFNGDACWSSGTNADRSAKMVYNTATATDYQLIKGTLSGTPQAAGSGGTAPKFWAIGRIGTTTTANDTYVWARAYCSGFLAYRGEIGCTVAGVETVWASNIPLTFSLDMTFAIGVGSNARQYQVYSGTTLVWQHTETGSASQSGNISTSTITSTYGANFRKWGAVAEIKYSSGGLKSSGRVAGSSVTDNQQPAYNGSYAMMYRTGTTNVSFPGYSAQTVIPNSFFDGASVSESPDVDANPTDGTITVTESKPYTISARVAVASNLSSIFSLNLQRYKASTTTWSTVQWGDSVSGVDSMQGSWVQYLEAGDKVRLMAFRAGLSNSNELTGEATGTKTYFALTGAT